MKKKLLAGLGTGVLFLGVSGLTAYATPISSDQNATALQDAALTGATIINFNNFTPAQKTTYDSLTIDNVTFATSDGASQVTDGTAKVSFVFTPINGKFVPPTDTYLSNLAADNHDLYFDFGTEVSAFIMAIGQGTTVSALSLSAYDSANNLIETLELPDMSTWAYGGRFGYYGISSAACDISSVSLNIADGATVFVDDVAYAANTPTPVPEPATLLLMGTGLFGLARAGLKKKA